MIHFLSLEYVGLALSYGLPLNGVLFWAVYMSCTVENRMVSVERIKQFIRIPSEAPWRIANCLPSSNWPNHGDIQINNLKVMLEHLVTKLNCFRLLIKSMGLYIIADNFIQHVNAFGNKITHVSLISAGSVQVQYTTCSERNLS